MFLDEENYIIPQTDTVVRCTRCFTHVRKVLLDSRIQQPPVQSVEHARIYSNVKTPFADLQARSWEEQHSVVILILSLGRRIGSTSGAAASG